MKVAICGAGNVGTYIANDLHSAGHHVMLLEKDVATASRLQGQLAVSVINADACEVERLHAAGLADVDVVVAATGDDEDNLVISLLAKQEFAVPRVVARVNHPANHWLFNESWGVDRAVSTPHLLTALVEEAVSVGSLVRLLELEKGEAGLVEVTLAEGSPAANRPLVELGMPHQATVVAVIRGGHVVVPRGDTVLQVGDEVMALVTPESEDEVKQILIGAVPPVQPAPERAPAPGQSNS